MLYNGPSRYHIWTDALYFYGVLSNFDINHPLLNASTTDIVEYVLTLALACTNFHFALKSSSSLQTPRSSFCTARAALHPPRLMLVPYPAPATMPLHLSYHFPSSSLPQMPQFEILTLFRSSTCTVTSHFYFFPLPPPLPSLRLSQACVLAYNIVGTCGCPL